MKKIYEDIIQMKFDGYTVEEAYIQWKDYLEFEDVIAIWKDYETEETAL